jgi:GYF domain 2
MASWFYASEGKQQGPFPDGQFRDLIAQGVVRPDTLVWTEGMAGWQKAAEIPGLVGGGAPPMIPAGGPPMMGGGGYGGAAGGSLTADFSAFGLLGRSIVFVIGILLVIPAPWVTVWFYKYITSHIHVPGRPNFGFAGQPMDIWWALMANALLTYAGATGISFAPLLAVIANAFLAWVILRWIVANLTSNGERLPLSFQGSAIGYVGWYLLMMISTITIIGWAWVIAFWMRWNCRNIEGTRREVVFNGSGWQILWRSVVFSLACSLIIPIPWMLRWYGRWFVSQFALVDRGAAARAY